MTDREQLAARIEAATGPDRELDIAIDHFLGWSPVPNPTRAGGLIDMMHGPGGVTVRRNTPAYTASIDAAMMLVPEGWQISSWMELHTVNGCYCHLAGRNFPSRSQMGDAKTMARALAAAAIRAGGV